MRTVAGDYTPVLRVAAGACLVAAVTVWPVGSMRGGPLSIGSSRRPAQE